MTLTHVTLQRDGAAARIALDRPQALNALTHAMIRSLDAALDEALADDGVRVVVLEGTGDRAFCAGGDVVSLRRSALDGDDGAVRFWADEYALDLRLSQLAKPVVSLMHGVTMGGGIGLGSHVRHRVVTEDLRAAMPEVGIGFVPDVGGTWLLSRSPGELGTHLALTAGHVGAGDAVLCGLADHVVPTAVREGLVADLAEGLEADAAIARHTVPVPEAPLAAQRSWVDAAYAGDDALAVVHRLESSEEPAAREAAAAIRTKSPTAVAVALAALRRARTLPDLRACLAHELAVSTAILTHPDFAEGVRAQLVDKDRAPRWAPATLEELDPEVVAGLLAL